MDQLLLRGVEAAKQGRPAEAARLFADVLATDEANARVRAWLGQALCASRRQKDGTRELHRAADRLLDQNDPTLLAQIIEIVVQLQQWGDVPAALDICERLARSHPGEPRVQHLRAMCLHQLNRSAEALMACRAAALQAPPEPMMAVLEASIEIENRLTDAAQQRLRAVLNRTIPPLVRFRAQKELARALDQTGDHDAAFEALKEAEAAARLAPEFQRVDLNLLPGMIASNGRTFTPDLMGRWSRTTFDDRGAPVFIVGFYRSGTTLAQEVFDAHPRCFVADEANLVHEALRELNDLRPTREPTAAKLATLDAAGVARLRRAYWQAARGRYGSEIDDVVFLDKFTLNTVDLGFINTVFPDAKVIFLVRDPRDVCISCFMQLMPLTAATAHLLAWERTADFYAAVMSWWLLIRDRLTVPWLEVRYESAVSNFEGTFRRCFDFLDLAWDPEVTRFHERAATKFVGSPSRHQVAQPLYTSSLRRWRRYERHFAPIAPRLQPFVERFGYEGA